MKITAQTVIPAVLRFRASIDLYKLPRILVLDHDTGLIMNFDEHGSMFMIKFGTGMLEVAKDFSNLDEVIDALLRSKPDVYKRTSIFQKFTKLQNSLVAAGKVKQAEEMMQLLLPRESAESISKRVKENTMLTESDLHLHWLELDYETLHSHLKKYTKILQSEAVQ